MSDGMKYGPGYSPTLKVWPDQEPVTIMYETKKPTEGMMGLVDALRLLSDCHTRDDDLAGFVVHSHGDLMFHSQADYIRAWEAVRHAIGLPTEAE